MSSWPRLLCCLFLWCSSVLAVAQAKTHHHRWEIGYQFKSPDCVCKLAFTINCQTPGPTIRATHGDTVVVTVTHSLLTENVAIHWHGIRQLCMLRIGTPWADGTEGVTQCPILPGDTFTYRFVVDRPGTYMYHVHYDMQHSAGLNGMIVVAVPPGQAEPFAYDREHTVLLNDRWNGSTYEQAATGLASVPLVCISQIPGPTIRAVQGAAADVTVTNSPLTDHVPIHWHGIREIGTPLADGTGVMQSPVQPGDTFMVDHLARYDMHRTAALSNTQAAGAAAAVPSFNAGEPAQHLSSSVRACFNYSRISDATRAGCSPPPAFAVAAGGRDHIVTNPSDLNSGSLFDWIVQLGTGSLFLIRVMQVALDDQRKKNGWGVVAMALVILLLVIPALPNTTMAARQFFHDGGHDQAVAGPVDAAPGLMPQSKVAADHSACTSDPNTPDPHRCVHHKNITT